MLLGLVGEYIGRIFDEAKGRPIYVVRRKLGFAPAEGEAPADDDEDDEDEDEEHFAVFT